MPQMVQSDENRVTVLIWHGNKKSLKSFGHAALRTYRGGTDGTGIYASWWPGSAIDQNGNLIGCSNGCKQIGPHNHTPDEDDLAATHNAQTQIDLYSLNVDAINQRFIQFSQGGYEWHLLGSFFISIKGAKNCSGLVSELLMVGGINDLLDFKSEIPHIILSSCIVGVIFFFLSKKYFSPFAITIADLKNLVNIRDSNNNCIRKDLSSLIFHNKYIYYFTYLLHPLLNTTISRYLSRKFNFTTLKSLKYMLIFEQIILQYIFRALINIPVNDDHFFINFFSLIGKNIFKTSKDIFWQGIFIASICYFFKENNIRNNLPYLLLINEVQYNFNKALELNDWPGKFLIVLRYLQPLLATSLVPGFISFSSIAVTPTHVEQLVEKAKHHENILMSRHTGSSNTSFFQRNKKILVLSGAGILATAGIFAVRNNPSIVNNLANIVNEGVNLLTRKLTN